MKASHREWFPKKGERVKNVAKKMMEAVQVPRSMPFVRVIPIKIPSQTNAMIPAKGMTIAQGRKSADDAMTTESSVRRDRNA